MGDLSHQLGLARETVWGTIVTPTRFLEFTSESLEARQNIQQSQGIRAGRRFGGQGRRRTSQDAGGTVTFEVAQTGFGILFEQLFGAVATTNPGTLAFQHTFTPGALTEKSLTLQKGVDTGQDSPGVVPFTYPGAKILSADFSIDQDGLLMVDVEFDAKEEETATALATASYDDPVVFAYSEGTLKVGGNVRANVRSVGSVRYVNNLQTDRRFLGSDGLKDEQTNVPFDEISGTLDVEFQNEADFYTLFRGDTAATLELAFVGGEIEPTHNFELNLSFADIRFEGETPKVSGPELVYQNVPFVGLDDPAGGDAATLVYQTSDALP